MRVVVRSVSPELADDIPAIVVAFHAQKQWYLPKGIREIEHEYLHSWLRRLLFEELLKILDWI